MRTLEGKVAVVTGAARGQGRSHALHLAQEGCNLLICDIAHDISGVSYSLGTQTELEETAHLVSQQNREVIALPCDVRDYAQVESVVNQAIQTFGKVDIIVNNAGIGGPIATTWELSEEAWRTMLDVNLTGVWHGCKAVASYMVGRKQGRIINISSTGGLKGLGMLSHYVAAKHGVIGLTRSLAIELAPHNVTANAICPGSVNTPLLKAQGELYGMDWPEAQSVFAGYQLFPNLLEPKDVSEVVVWLASDAARYATGMAFNIDAGFMQK